MASVARLAATDAGVPRATIKLDGQCHQFGSEAGVSLRLAGCEAVDHLEILPLDVTQIAQTLLQAVDRRPPLVRENTDAPHRPDLLLRPRRERDTGATFVSITSRFALKARVATESGSQVIMKTVGGKALADIGYADSMSVGKAAAFGVTTAVVREDGDPFGRGVDGLLGMSFQGRELPPKEVQSAHRGAGGRRGGQARRTEVWAARPAALLREVVRQSGVAV